MCVSANKKCRKGHLGLTEGMLILLGLEDNFGAFNVGSCVFTGFRLCMCVRTQE